MLRQLCWTSVACLSLATPAVADDATAPRPIPLTRPEMKQYLEDMKQRTPRIPLPELTAEERQALGDRADNYETRLRHHYLPWVSNQRPGFTRTGRTPGRRTPDANELVPYTLKVQMFWIVSRVNNCQYCQGHQESKLLRAGESEERIAQLDGDWTSFTPAERAAFNFARKATFEPHLFNDADFRKVSEHFTHEQILEMLLSLAGNNSINRWKEGVGVPQSSTGGSSGLATLGNDPSKVHSYLTPTLPEYATSITKVAPVRLDPATGKPTRATTMVRPGLESRAEVEAFLAEAQSRKPRLPLASPEETEAFLKANQIESPVPLWIRLLAKHPEAGKSRVLTHVQTEREGDLSPLTKARIRWVVGRQDRAWYAVGLAKADLLALGQTEDSIYALDGSWKHLPARDQALLTVARNLAASPVVLTDQEVAQAVKLAGARDVVQTVHYVTAQAAMNRITEVAGLPLEPKSK